MCFIKYSSLKIYKVIFDIGGKIMALQPKISGETIERAYEEYRNGHFLVNRRYQRKLVWELEEKKQFIDSIIQGYPVPSFLFAVNYYKNENRHEIM